MSFQGKNISIQFLIENQYVKNLHCHVVRDTSKSYLVCPIKILRVRLWLMRAWVRILFAAIFADIPRADKSL